MNRKTMAVWASSLALSAPACAQDLVALSASKTGVLGSACFETRLDCLQMPTFDTFMPAFTGRDWPLVVIEWYLDLRRNRRSACCRPSPSTSIAADGYCWSTPTSTNGPNCRSLWGCARPVM